MLCNGNLVGLVAIQGMANNFEPWAAALIGTLSGGWYLFVQRILQYFEVDDHIDAIPVHFGCGFLGSFAVGFFDWNSGVFYGYGGR